MGSFENFAPDAIENTLEDGGESESRDRSRDAPPCPSMGVDPGSDAQTTMIRMCWEGLERRLPKHELEHKERLSYELDIIEKTGFAQYFLIVRDIAQHARHQWDFLWRSRLGGGLAGVVLSGNYRS